MLSREEFGNRLLHLVPNAKFAFWVDEPNVDNKGYNNVVKMGGYCVAWYPENAQPLPSLEDLQALKKEDVDASFLKLVKFHRDKTKADDLSIVAAYEVEKKTNPTLDFSLYLDSLEAKSKVIKDDIESKARG